jgi:iron complex transport system substrate-binding protein
VLTALVALSASACGGGEDDAGQSAGPSDGGAFPVTIEHEHGSTTIEAEPERVVTIGYTDQDFVLALGVRPVGVREWIGERPHATWPWARDELGDAKPEVLPAGELNIEQVAALRPDVIIGIYAGLKPQEYEQLSRIAPTVPASGKHVPYGTPWQEQTLLTGRALGREAEAEQLVSDVEAQFERAREEHPEFARATALFAYREGPGKFGAYASADPRGRFLQALGFQASDRVDELAGDQFWASVSVEQLRLLDEDVIVLIDLVSIAADRDELMREPLFRRLDAVREGRDVYPAEDPAAALSFSSPLSLPLAIDAIVPQLAEAVARSGAGSP